MLDVLSDLDTETSIYLDDADFSYCKCHLFILVCAHSHVICAVQAGLAGPGSDGDACLFIVILAFRMKPPAVKVRQTGQL